MKRAVLKNINIEKCIKYRVFATPLNPQKLFFKENEKVYIAFRIEDIKRLDIDKEYNYIFVFDKYIKEDKNQASKLYDNEKWKYFWKIKDILRIKPFSLKDLISRTHREKNQFKDYYRGQEMTHTIVRDIFPEDENIFEFFTSIIDNDVGETIEDDIYNKKIAMEEEKILFLNEKTGENLNQIIKISQTNLKKEQRRSKRKSIVYERNAELSARLKLEYKNICQICGSTFIIPETKRNYSESHHIAPLGEGGNDVYKNIIIVCPTCHKKFDKEFYKLNVEKKEFKAFDSNTNLYKETQLYMDKHLFVN